MVRPVGGRSSSRRAAPSAQEMMNSLGRQVFGDDFQSGPMAASKGAFNKISDIMFDDSQSMDYYAPTKYQNLAGLPEEFDSGRQFYEVVDLTGDYQIPGMVGPQNEEDNSPADLTVVPTSTTNPARPRTVAAGYDEDEEKLTVVFRDGTFYNYFEVTGNEWAAFKANRSKGAFIYRLLDFKPRGPADVSSVSKKAQQAFYRYSRGAQIASKGKAKGQTGTKYKTIAQSSRGKNPSTGGKNPKGR